MRRIVVALLLVAGLIAAPSVAEAASPRVPGQVGLVSFIGAGTTSSGATLTIAWKGIPYAAKYDVIVSTSFSGVQKKQAVSLSTRRTSATLTRLRPGTAYFVQVRPVNSVGKWGLRSNRVGHVTISSQPSAAAQAAMSDYRVLSWNICTNACGNFVGREPLISSRLNELQADIIGLQESDDYRTNLPGYAYAHSPGLNIMYKASRLSLVTSGGTRAEGRLILFTASANRVGEGASWAALRDNLTGKYVVVFNTHLQTGKDAASIHQREYEANQLLRYMEQVKADLRTHFGGVTDWSTAPSVLIGDFNWSRTRASDSTGQILTNAGWFDAFEQAQTLTNQHLNTGNPDLRTTPPIGITWGDHVDQIRVNPGTTAVTSWANAGKIAGGKYVAPLPSDHSPLLVGLKF